MRSGVRVRVVGGWSQSQALNPTPEPQPPTLNPRPPSTGSWTAPEGPLVTISVTPKTAVIYYTLDGTRPVPGAASTAQYKEPFFLDVTAERASTGLNASVRAVGVLQGFRNSQTVTAIYTLAGSCPEARVDNGSCRNANALTTHVGVATVA